MRLPDYLIRSAGRFPDKDLVVHRGRRFSYSAILGRATAVGRWLSEHRDEADFRGGVLTDDPADYIAWYFGIQMAGGAVVGLNTQTTERSLTGVIRDAGISVLFLHSRFSQFLPQTDEALARVASLKTVVVEGDLPERGALPTPFRVVPHAEILEKGSKGGDPDDRDKKSEKNLAQIIYTSGTTGEPKGVMLRHENLVANTESILAYLRLTPDDRAMAVLPFFYSYGNSVMLTHVAAGGALVVNQNFLYPNVVIEEMIREGVTGFSGVPSTFAILLHRSAVRSHSFPTLRYITQAGGAMSPALAEDLKKVFPGVSIYIMYGQTEASARLSYLSPSELDRKTGSIGKAIPGVTLDLLDREGSPVGAGEVGEIVASGPNLMAGYWGNPGETAKVLKDGALWTGDLARIDEEGFLYIVGRGSEMIKSGAHRIAPREIEDVLHEHEAVHEAAVVGMPDAILGETIKACVVRKPDRTCTERELIVHCRKALPAFKVPHLVVFHDELPKTATGKVRKGDLR